MEYQAEHFNKPQNKAQFAVNIIVLNFGLHLKLRQ